MKISSRILLINFAIVALVLGSSAIAFYSIMYNVLTSQESKYLLNSANDFIYAYRGMMQNMEDDFLYLAADNLNNKNRSINIKSNSVDFIFQISPDSSKIIKSRFYNRLSYSGNSYSTVSNFLKNNPFVLIETYKTNTGKVYCYGKLLNNAVLDEWSKKIKAEIALVWENIPSEVSNESNNRKYYYTLKEAYGKLYNKNNFEVFSTEGESADILATIYKPSESTGFNRQYQFLIFRSLSETVDLRSNLTYILIIIGVAGILLSLILTLFFTDKIRKHITALHNATKLTKEGNFNYKIPFKSKDELGALAGAFNTMLEELEKNQKAKNEYSEFITLINKNPTLAEISDAALRKIVKTCGFAIGAIYSVDDNTTSLISSYGVGGEEPNEEKLSLFKSIIQNREELEFSFDKNYPTVSAGLVSIEIKHLLIIPIIYNNRVNALLELGGFEKPSADAKEYLSKIKEQLAIGLTNAIAFVKLENLVEELKKLNEDYQKQNIQIRKQNETLVELHEKLKEKADELEIEKRKAEEAAHLKSQFLASMSHELRTPMNSVLGLTDLILADNSLEGKNRERLMVVSKSGKRLMNLINDILDLSKIEAGKMEIHNENVLLEDLIRDVENSIRPLVIEKEIEFSIERNTSTGIIIKTDKGRVTQVLINLLGNAVKFTDKGFVKLKVSSTGDDYKLRFEVSDTGIGISENDQKNIFEEFRQLDGTITRKYSGTGLGLAICKKFADMLNGQLSVKSKPGKGSTFVFEIPFEFVSTYDVEKVEEPRQNAASKQTGPILVIDDDPDVRYTIGQYLSAKGYDVEYAEDGEKGIRLAAELQPFAITLDILLPKKDGWTVLKELKEFENTKNIPVILISILGDKNLGYGFGAYDYFVKPVSFDKLIHSLKTLERNRKKRIEKIVIVDDDESEFEKFKTEFKDQNIRIEYIKDSEYAFNRILETQPDLIILDLLMPKIDGITLSHKLKTNIHTKHIPIILSSGKDLTEDEKQALNSIVEEITVKANGHPLDVLKVVRDRIQMHESAAGIEHKSPGSTIEKNSSGTPDTNIEHGKSNPDENAVYRGDVLIVDDDAETLFTTNELVKACNCRTQLAKSGRECLALLNQKIPDLILLDIMMPEMDGFQTLKKIKQNPAWANIPVFAVTARAMLEDKEVILRHGFDDYIPKPVNSSVMAFKIEKVFSKIKLS